MKIKTAVIIDYKLGNLQSIYGAVEKIGHTPLISNRAEDIQKADCLILPGVGAFSDGMKNILSLGLEHPLKEAVLENKKPLLAICLGMQLLGEGSTEFGNCEGLGWINASIRKLKTEDRQLRIPHIGWDDCMQTNESILFEGISNPELFYFAHSYYFNCNDPEIIVGACDYGNSFPAAIQKNNIYGTQFHPEKSQMAGLNLLKNFIEKT